MRFDKASALSHERILCKVRPSYQGAEEAKAEQPDSMFPVQRPRQETARTGQGGPEPRVLWPPAVLQVKTQQSVV